MSTQQPKARVAVIRVQYDEGQGIDSYRGVSVSFSDDRTKHPRAEYYTDRNRPDVEADFRRAVLFARGHFATTVVLSSSCDHFVSDVPGYRWVLLDDGEYIVKEEPEPPLNLDEIERAIHAASRELERLCDGGRFRMCVPVQDTDSDMVLNQALSLALKLVKLLQERSIPVSEALPPGPGAHIVDMNAPVRLFAGILAGQSQQGADLVMAAGWEDRFDMPRVGLAVRRPEGQSVAVYLTPDTAADVGHALLRWSEAHQPATPKC